MRPGLPRRIQSYFGTKSAGGYRRSAGNQKTVTKKDTQNSILTTEFTGWSPSKLASFLLLLARVPFGVASEA